MDIKVLMGALALALTFGTAAASAEEFRGNATFGWITTGQTYTIEGSRPYFLGAFSGTQFFEDGAGPLHNSALVCPGFNDIGVDAGGYCTVTTASGDLVFLKWTCPPVETAPGDILTCAGRTTVVGGTGMFEGATGGNDLTGHITVILPDGSSAGYSELKNYELNY